MLVASTISPQATAPVRSTFGYVPVAAVPLWRDMRITHAYLVLVDISGYTQFVTDKSLALDHAEKIITELINAILDQSRHPMILNKLEGDAALLYQEIETQDTYAVQNVLAQVRAFFPAFHQRAEQLRMARAHCHCEACSNISALRLKAFLHVGDVAIKRVRNFDELAGPALILLHRLMKNVVPQREYVLMTTEAAVLSGLPREMLKEHHEMVESMGEHVVWLTDPENLPNAALSAKKLKGWIPANWGKLMAWWQKRRSRPTTES